MPFLFSAIVVVVILIIIFIIKSKNTISDQSTAVTQVASGLSVEKKETLPSTEVTDNLPVVSENPTPSIPVVEPQSAPVAPPISSWKPSQEAMPIAAVEEESKEEQVSSEFTEEQPKNQ